MAKSGSLVLPDKTLIEFSHNIMSADGPGTVLTQNDIRQPTVAIVTKFYTQYLVDLGIDTGNIVDVPAYQAMPHPDIHRTMLQHGLLAKGMQYFLDSVNSPHKFTMTDLIFPTVQRHKIFLSELLNCHVFAMQAQPKVENSIKNFKGREEKLQQLRERVSQLQNRKAQLLHDRGVREDKIKDFDKRMTYANEQHKKFSSEMSEQRQRTYELQQELEETTQKHQQLLQSKELHINNLKQLEGQLVNSPMRFKQDLSILENSKKVVEGEVAERESILTQRQNMDTQMSNYFNVLKEVKDMAIQLGDMKKKNARNTSKVNEMMTQKQKIALANDKLTKEKLSAADRLQKLAEKSMSLNQTAERKTLEMQKVLADFEREQDRMTDLLDSTDQAARTYTLDKKDQDAVLLKREVYETAALDLFNLKHETEIKDFCDEFDDTLMQKFNQLKSDFEDPML